MVVRILALCFAVVLSGCAATALQPEVASSIRQNKVAVAAYVEDKKINYSEMVYKVLWNETHSQTAAFEGLWDVDRDLTDLLTEELRQVGVDGYPVTSVLVDEDYGKFVEAIRTAQNQEGRKVPVALSEEIRNELYSSGFKYLILLRSSGLHVQTTSMFSMAQLNMPVFLIVSDLESNSEKYNESFWLMRNIDFEESVREIEDDNLAQVRETVASWMTEMMQGHFPTMFGASSKQ